MRTVVGLYDRFDDAQNVVQALRQAGFRSEDISLVASDQKGEYKRYFEGGEGKAEDIAEGAAAGAGVGAVLGGLGGLLVGLGALAIPGIGPVLAAGPIASALAGAGLGAVAGGIVGALTDLGIPEDQANRYAEGIRRGGTLVVVRSEDHLADQAVQVMNRFNPVDVNRRVERWKSENWTRFDETAEPLHTRDFDRLSTMEHGDETTIPIVEEDIEIGKREVERDAVHVKAYVEETPVEKSVNLRSERIDVDRRPVDRPVSGDAGFVEGELHLTQHEEEPMVRKSARVTEEVHIRKDEQQRQETVRDTVRKQRVEVSNMTDDDWRTYDNRFKQHYQTQYGSTGRDYGYYQNAYRYGYMLGADERYRDMDWNTLESRARQDWERSEYHGDSTWDDIKQAVRNGWESVTR